MILSTIKNNKPTSRTVLLKEVNNKGFFLQIIIVNKGRN